MTKKERLPIYKKALEIVQSGEEAYGMESGDGLGLCLLLPCIWLNLNSFLDAFIDEKGKEFSFGETTKYFPEFAKYDWHHNIDYMNDAVKWRIDTLKSIIAEYKRK